MVEPADENLQGVDDPEKAAKASEAILEESEERTKQAEDRAEDGTIEHRSSDETA